MKGDFAYLNHIVDAIENINHFVGDLDQQNFLHNDLVQSAVIRQLEIIGEAVKNLSPKIKNKNPATPWKDIAGLRDKLIHVYFGVDLDLVWEIIQKDLPALKRQIRQILRTLK